MSEDTQYTIEDIPRLDELHKRIGLGEEWLTSSRRAEIISRGEAWLDIFTRLVQGLWVRLGREPTAEEVYGYIYGTPEEQAIIWDSK